MKPDRRIIEIKPTKWEKVKCFFGIHTYYCDTIENEKYYQFNNTFSCSACKKMISAYTRR